MTHRPLRQSWFRSLATAVFTALLPIAAMAQDPAARAAIQKGPKPAEIVFIGNSYTYFHDLPALVVALGAAEQPPRTITAIMLAPGGFSLRQHWDAKGDDAPRTVLGKRRPDFVVLQEQSRLPIDKPTQTEDYAAKFAALVVQQKAVPVWFMTWARLAEPEAQATITKCYTKIARECGGLLAPVGSAWKIVRDAHPEQGLHMDDGSHPNPSGSYLAACVLHATMFGSDVTTFPDKLVREGPDSKQVVLVELGHDEGERLRAAAAQALAALGKQEKQR